MIEYHPSSPKDQSRIHQFGKKVLPGIFSGLWADRGRDLERRYLDSRPGRFWKVGCIRNLSSKNRCERSIDLTKGRRNYFPNSRWYSKAVRKRSRIPRINSKAETNRKERRSQWRNSRRIGRVSTGRLKRWRWKLEEFCGLFKVNVPKEETFRIPLKYIDVTRSTHTDLYVVQEKRFDDYWNVDANRYLSDSWKGFKNPPKGYAWFGGATDKSSSDHWAR